MMKKFVCLSVCIFCLLCNNCGEKETDVEKGGGIYGTVTDLETAEPLSDANVTLYPGEATALTGYDGQFLFSEIPVGTYTIKVSKLGYDNLTSNEPIIVKKGGKSRRDIQMSKEHFSRISITDIYGRQIDVIDFGNNESVTIRSFNIFNNGTVTERCVMRCSCPWIRSVDPNYVEIMPGQNITVSVEVDRGQLTAEKDSTFVYVIGDELSNRIKIKINRSVEAPTVVTLPVTNRDGSQGPLMNTFNANVTCEGFPPYITRGFCYSSTNTNPTINDNRIVVSGGGTGTYSYTEWNLPIPTAPVTYYVRAWIIGYDNSVHYGNIQTFVYNDVL